MCSERMQDIVLEQLYFSKHIYTEIHNKNSLYTCLSSQHIYTIHNNVPIYIFLIILSTIYIYINLNLVKAFFFTKSWCSLTDNLLQFRIYLILF